MDISAGLFAEAGWRLSVSQGAPAELSSCAPRWSDPQGTLRVLEVPGDPDRLFLSFLDLAGARISRGDRAVEAFPLVPDLPPNSFEHFLLDVVLPRLLAAEEGGLVVHGALVARGAEGICLVGESGQGKSTLSAALRGAGWAFHGDDAVRLRPGPDGIAARATYPSLRLFPESLRGLFHEPPGGLSPVADYLDKYRLDPEGAAGPARLRAVFVLGDDEGSGEVGLRPLAASRLCMTLVGQSFALDPPDKGAAHRRLAAAGAVTAAVSGFALCYPRDYARLPEVIGRIGAALDRVPATAGEERA